MRKDAWVVDGTEMVRAIFGLDPVRAGRVKVGAFAGPAAARERLMEAVAEVDDSLLEKYLGGEEPGEEEVRAAIRQATIGLKMIPVLCGSAFRKRGVQPLVDAIVDYLPSPLDVPAATGIAPGTETKVDVPTDDNHKFCSLAFKLWTGQAPPLGEMAAAARAALSD